MVKSEGGQRESDGVVVPVIGVEQNTPGGKDSDFDHAWGEGKRQGMTGVGRSNYPGRPSPVVLEGVGPYLEGARTSTQAMGCGQAV